MSTIQDDWGWSCTYVLNNIKNSSFTQTATVDSPVIMTLCESEIVVVHFPGVIIQCVLWLYSVSCGYTVCPVVIQCVLWLYSVSCGYTVCPVVIQCVLWLYSVSCGYTVCPVVIQCVLWLYSVSCGYTVCPVVIQCVLWLYSVYKSHHEGVAVGVVVVPDGGHAAAQLSHGHLLPPACRHIHQVSAHLQQQSQRSTNQ